MKKTLELIFSKKSTLALLALVGFVLTIALAVVYNNANFSLSAGPSFCTDANNPVVNCDAVAKSTNSQFLGIPLAYWGMFYYVFILMLLFVDKLKEVKFLYFLEVFKNPYSYIAVLGIFSFFISMMLAFVSFVSLNMICVLCFITYFINLLIALVASECAEETFGKAISTSINDFFEGVKNPKYTLLFCLVVSFAVIFLAFTTMSNIFTPQVKDEKIMKELFTMKTNKYSNVAKGNILGDKDAKVVVKMYSDVMCPFCVIENRMMHKVVNDYDNVRVEFIQFPLDKECNKSILNDFHVGACEFSRLALAAENQGRFWDMTNMLFDEKPFSIERAMILAEENGFDIEKLHKDMYSKSVKDKLLEQIDYSLDKKVVGTPAFSINGKLYIGIKPYSELGAMLIDAGARKRKNHNRK